MGKEYDGLEVIKIPMLSNDIFTASNCMQNVMNIMVGYVCVSETEGLDFCTDYSGYSRHDEYVTPRAPGTDFTC